MKLSVEERIIMFSLFPQQHDYETLKDFEKLSENLKFDEEETRNYDVKTETIMGRVQVQFNREAAEGYYKEIKLTSRVLSCLTETLIAMNENRQLTMQAIPLYEKIVKGKKEKK